MSPDNPQSGKRGTKAGNRSANEKTFGAGLDPDVPSGSFSDAPNASVDDRRDAGLGATEFGTTTGATNYGTTGAGYGQSSGNTEQQTSGILNQVREKAASQLNEQKARATDGLGNVAQAVRQSTHHLREQQYDTVAQFVERAADQIDRFSNHLRERDLNDLVSEAQRFARQQPAVFIGSSFAAGILAARVIKASRPTRSFDSPPYSGYDVGRGGTDPAFNGGGADTGFNRGGALDRDAGSSYGGSTSFGTAVDRPGDLTGRGDL